MFEAFNRLKVFLLELSHVPILLRGLLNPMSVSVLHLESINEQLKNILLSVKRIFYLIWFWIFMSIIISAFKFWWDNFMYKEDLYNIFNAEAEH